MSEENNQCPKCNSSYSYQDGPLWICPECFHEWTLESESIMVGTSETAKAKFLDANGVQLQTGDTVIVAKDLKLGSGTLKSGTKVKNIRLLDEPEDDHDISCKIPGFGSLYLKCSVVKKAK